MTVTLHLDDLEEKAISEFRLPDGVQLRLQELLDRQDDGTELTVAERREAEGLVNLSEFLSLLRSWAQRDQS